MPTFNRINSKNIPKTTDRMVILSEAELSRLKQQMAKTITELHLFATEFKSYAKTYKSLGHTEMASRFYKTSHNFLKKAKNLGEVQYQLKHSALSNAELLEQFELNGMVVGVITE